MRRHITLGLLAAVFVLGGAAPVCAHSIKLFATVEGSLISGVAYIPGKAPLRDITVQVFADASAAPVTNVTTDAEGRFTFPPPPASELLLVVELPDGHRAEWRMQLDVGTDKGTTPAKGSPGIHNGGTSSAPVGVPDADVRLRAIERQLRDLAVQLERQATQTRLHDILGGIGYLVGVSGIVFYFKATRERNRETRDRRT